DEQGRIFERFFRSPAVRDAQGVGLGLYLAREIAAANGGYIKVTSLPGNGSTFSLCLPQMQYKKRQPKLSLFLMQLCSLICGKLPSWQPLRCALRSGRTPHAGSSPRQPGRSDPLRRPFPSELGCSG